MFVSLNTSPFPIEWGEGAGCGEDFKEMKNDLLATNPPFFSEAFEDLQEVEPRC